MNKRRDFIRNTLIATAATPLVSSGLQAAPTENSFFKSKANHWVWVNPDVKDTDEQLVERYSSYREAGIHGILFEADSERHFRAAKKHKLEAHRWNWTMNKGVKEIMDLHPEWYAVSREGKSCITEPPYVDYYRWLCPSKPEVQQYWSWIKSGDFRRVVTDQSMHCWLNNLRRASGPCWLALRRPWRRNQNVARIDCSYRTHLHR